MRDWETIGELTLSNFEEKQKSPKSIHCAMKPIRIQLECPYNSRNETKNTHVWVFTFLYSLHKQCTFLYISTCAWGREHIYAIIFIQQCIATRCFTPWINPFLNESSEPVIQRSIQMSHLLKQGLAATYWWFYCHIYFFHDRPKSAKVPEQKHFFNYQYWPKSLYFRPQKENKTYK